VAITIVDGHRSMADWARQRVDELERRWSRFTSDSDISRLNRAGGSPVEVSPDTVVAVRAACAAWAFTDGRFDPTVHDSLLRLGYDESIEAVRGRGSVTAERSLPSPGCSGIVFDEATGFVQLPPDVRLDLGGIGKGLAADDVASGLLDRGATGAMVNIGGDVRVVGSPSTSTAWRVEIEDPRTNQICAVVRLLDGGVATSTTLRRRWASGRRTVHHLIDPSTGANAVPTDAPVVGVTVVAGTAAWADALSKVPFVEDRDPADRFERASALVLRDDGTARSYGAVDFSIGVHA
jgi:thiamine biosynthesis lipoprotein